MRKKSSQLDGNTTGDYSSVGLFFPLPARLARQFPTLSKDRSPAHVTFLIIGKVDPSREQDLLRIVSDQVRRFGAVKCSLMSRDEFKNPKGQSIHHIPIAFDRDVASLRRAVKRELSDAGFDIGDSFPNYHPHATLEYAEANDPYTGPEPTGTFEPVIEVWGMNKVHRIPFPCPKTADLNPSLGLPSEAGPCYLADRIFQNVRNKNTRDALIKEIEEGGREFDGKDERLVYDAIKEHGPDRSTIYLLPHAQRRMDERGITVHDIRSGLKNWLRWLNREKSMQTSLGKKVSEELMYGRKILWEDPKDRLTMVFRGTKRKGEYVVITTYWSDHYNTSHRPTNCDLPVQAPKTGASGEYQAAGIVFMRGSKILLLRRGITSPWMPGSWTLVVGGVEKGESPKQAALREAFEETKLKPTNLKLLGVANSPGEATVHIFLSQNFTGEVELDWENDKFEWVGTDTLYTYAMPRLQRWFAYKSLEAFGGTPVKISSKISALADKQALNKFYPADLIGQAISVLDDDRYGVDEGPELADELRDFSRRLEPAWRNRNKRAARLAPPGFALSNPKRYGLMSLKYVYGEFHDDPRTMTLVCGDDVKDKSGKHMLFVGLDSNAEPVLAKNKAELTRKKNVIEKQRLHFESQGRS